MRKDSSEDEPTDISEVEMAAPVSENDTKTEEPEAVVAQTEPESDLTEEADDQSDFDEDESETEFEENELENLPFAGTFEVKVSDIENKAKFKSTIKKLLKKAYIEKSLPVVSVVTDSFASDAKSESHLIGFGFSDSESADLISLPYTKERYFTLSRKEEKEARRVIKSLLCYAMLSYATEIISQSGEIDKKLSLRLKQLNKRLQNEKKILPATGIFADAAKSVTK